MKPLLAILRLFNLLSLDIALGAICMAWMINHCLGFTTPPMWLLWLGMAIWAVYLTDHLYDAHKPLAYTYRRRFYKKHTTLITMVFVANLVTGIVLFITHYTPQLLVAGIPAAGVSALYLILNWALQRKQQPFYAKEVLIAAGYTLGVGAIPLAIAPAITLNTVLLMSACFFMALWNVWILAYFEYTTNQAEGQTSAGQWMTTTTIKRIATLCMALFAACVILLVFNTWWPLQYYLLWAAVFVYMGVPLVIPAWFTRGEKFRKWADAPFLLPAGVWLMECIVEQLK